MARFGKMVKLVAFKPFTSAQNALENINAVSENKVTDDLRNFLEMNLPKARVWPQGRAIAAPRRPLLWRTDRR